MLVIHESKEAVDKTKTLNNINFQFDHAFGAEDSTEDLYAAACRPLVDFTIEGGFGTCFACESNVIALPRLHACSPNLVWPVPPT